MITRLNLANFKGHQSTSIDFGRLTVLVGDNGSGKTSVLDALALLGALGSKNSQPNRILSGNLSPRDWVRRGSDGSASFTLKGTNSGMGWNAVTTLKLTSDDSSSYQVNLNANIGGTTHAAYAEGGERTSHGPGWDALSQALGSNTTYRLRPENIAAAAYSELANAPIAEDGTNTAVALAALKLSNDEVFEKIEVSLRTIVPVERIRLRPWNVHVRGTGPTSLPSHGTIVGNKLFFDFKGATGVPAHNASHGTLVALALLTVLFSPDRPNLILLDDFDHALHPRAQMELVRLLKSLLNLEEFRELQIISTTHSPYTLDELSPNEVRAFALRDDGTVATKPLSKHPDAERMQGTLGAGQLWSLDAERDWILGPRK